MNKFERWLDKPAAFIATKGFASVFALAVLAACGIVIFRMTEEDRTFQNVGAVVQTGVLVIGLLSLVLIARQTRTTATLATVNSYHLYFGDLITAETRAAVRKLAVDCGFVEQMDKQAAITDDSINKIFQHADRSVLSSYLDDFEEFCGAVNAGVVNGDYAYKLESTRVIRIWVVFNPYIRKSRHNHNDERCYLEIERLGSAWKQRRDAESTAVTTNNGMGRHFT